MQFKDFPINCLTTKFLYCLLSSTPPTKPFLETGTITGAPDPSKKYLSTTNTYSYLIKIFDSKAIDFLDILKTDAASVRPDVLPKPSQFESYIGHTAINLAISILTETKVKGLERDLLSVQPHFPDKSQIWLDFKDFHRRLELNSSAETTKYQPEHHKLEKYEHDIR